LDSDETILARAMGLIEAAPHSAPALTLYGLVSTLEYEQAGCLFKLTKLRDLDGDARALAYALMEMMARGANTGPAWEAAKAAMDRAVRGG
jgi:hypothetical protein